MTSNIQLGAEFRKLTGRVLPLRPFETILKVKSEEGSASALIETYRYTETTREIRFTGKGKRLYRITAGQSAPEVMTAWESDYSGEVIRKFGKVYEGTSHSEKTTYERDCYRPGSSRVPLDNYTRVISSPSTPKMERYW